MCSLTVSSKPGVLPNFRLPIAASISGISKTLLLNVLIDPSSLSHNLFRLTALLQRPSWIWAALRQGGEREGKKGEGKGREGIRGEGTGGRGGEGP